MSRFKKKQILELISQMERANELLKNADLNKRLQFTETLSQCQQAAIEMGGRLEMAGAAEEVVHLLEDYCENIYQQSISLTDEKKIRHLAKQIQKQLSTLANKIRYKLPPDQKEMIFLPYKASMWDSLESVWMAARDDADCEAYVIPIPYFDKNPDGTFQQMHYEGTQYPSYVPITSWEEYDISVRKPDAIFIHNPYDQYNYVTSVHPRFYASELKKYTDMLVYIPYFVCMDDVPEHFCTVPAVAYADKVIVQSEKVMNTYKENYVKWLGQGKTAEEKKRLQSIADGKFFPLGSPKVDKVLSTRREELEMPGQWKEKIDEDGKRKKIVLYNTTIDAFLKHQDCYLDKLEKVLEIFEQNREILLMWRPHPLLEDTMYAMAPHLLERYRQIVRDYRQKNFGIYDESADLNRAIALSDAYYGDLSSVAALYWETGKPVMIQNVEI